MFKEVRILILEDNPADAELMEQEMRKGGIKFLAKKVETKEKFIEELKVFSPNIILADYKLPSFDGVSALAILRKQSPDIPLIIVSGTLGEERAVETLKSGATDYVLKEHLERLVPAVCRALREVKHRLESSRMKEELRLLSSAVEATMDGIQITDLSGYIIYSNKALEEIHGYSSGELTGKHIKEMSSDPEFVADVIIPETKENGSWAGEVMGVNKEENLFPVWLTTSLIKDAEGKPTAMIGICRDITEKKQAEYELKKYTAKLKEANYLKDLFTDIMHHDLLSPAAIIKSAIELQITESLDDNKREMLLMVHRNAKRLIEMIENASTYEKLESLDKFELEKRDLNEILETVAGELKPLMDEKNIKLEYPVKETCYVTVNPVIESSFSNLLSNAIKFSPEGKKIEMGIEDNDTCKVYIKDWGCGIKEVDKGKLFTRFQRPEKQGVKGSGLGLAIVKRIVELHKGKVWVEDNPEGGSIFFVSLPK